MSISFLGWISFFSLYAFSASIAFLILYLFRSNKAFIKKRLCKFFSIKESFVDNSLIVAGSLFALTVLIVFLVIGLHFWLASFFALICAIIGPFIIAKNKRDKFVRSFDNALSESLSAIASSLKAGLTLVQSLELAAQNCPEVFAAEINMALKEYRLGMSIEVALDNTRKRVSTQNASIAFGALIIGNKLGGDLPEILTKIVSTIRERERVEGKLKSLTAQGRTQGLMLCAAPPVIGFLMYLLDPTKTSVLFNTLQGQILLSLAIALEVIGIFVTRKIMRLEI